MTYHQMIYITNDEPICCNCKHFYQHYFKCNVQGKESYRPMSWGHCTCLRIKNRRVTECCDNFKYKEESINERTANL